VVVVNPPPGGGTSATATFTIDPRPPAQQNTFPPTITCMLPLTTTAGGAAITLSVFGGNFAKGATVQWNGDTRQTTFIDSNQLEVSITAADIATPGQATVTVANPGQNGGSSDEWIYPVISPGVTAFPAGPQPVGNAPVAAAVDTGLHRVYVVHRGIFRDVCINGGDCAQWPSDVVSVVDQASGNLLTTIAVGTSVNGEGQAIAVDSTRHRVFVTNADDNTVTVIDGTTNTTLATTTVDNRPEGIAVDSGSGIVYVAASNVTLLNAGTGAVIASVPLGGAAWAIAVDGTSHLAYALAPSSPAVVAAVDGNAQAVRSRVTLPGTFYTYLGIAVDPGSRVYVSDYNTASVTAIDTSGSAPAVISSFSGAAKYAEAVAVDPNSHLVYVVSSGGGAVNVFNGNGAQQKSIGVLRLPTAFAIDQTSGCAYVADTESGSLSVVDMSQLALTGTIPLGV
jgi:YVTN family beta-propeller protein